MQNWQQKLTQYLKKYLIITSFFIFFSFPASTNYTLEGYEFGGGDFDLGSSNYFMQGVLGETTELDQQSSSYKIGSGLIYVEEANTPAAPTLQNTDSWYNKLEIILNTSNNPTDATYAIAITDDDWATTEWVQNDNTVGATLGSEDFQTYANWGGASGEYIIGLQPDTTYKVKVKASQGQYTEGPLGPEASAATSNVSISFDIDVSSSDEETGPPYAVAMGELSFSSVSTATDKVWIDLSTNAELGAYVYIYDANAGLKSTATNYTIDAVSADLTGQTEGFGVRSDSVGQTSGGPLAAQSPYSGAGDTVGIVDTTVREVYSSTSNPITDGRGSLLIKAKASNLTPGATDYTDIITMIASGTF